MSLAQLNEWGTGRQCLSEGDSELLGNYLSAFCLNQLFRIKEFSNRKRIFRTFCLVGARGKFPLWMRGWNLLLSLSS